MALPSGGVVLDEHVLYCIAETIINRLKAMPASGEGALRASRHLLYDLRLSSKLFANMCIVNAFLFARVRLRATQDQIAIFRGLSLQRVGPYVKIVDFIPSPYQKCMTFQSFKNIQLVEGVHLMHPEQYSDQDDPLLAAREIAGDDESNVINVKTDRELRGTYQMWKDFAEQDETVIQKGGELYKLWIGALQAFVCIEEVHVSSLVDRCTHRDDSMCAEVLRYRSVATAGSGDILLETAMDCLKATKVQIRGLKVTCALRSKLLSGQKDLWQGLDVSKLEKFDIEELFIDSYGRYHGAGPLWGSLIEQARSTLQDIYLGQACKLDKLTCHCMPDTHLPILKRLTLEFTEFDAPSVAKGIQQSPEMEHLVMEECRQEGSYGAWLLIFKAIREHPKLLHVRVEGELIYDAPFSLCFVKGDDVDIPLPHAWEAMSHDIERDLVLYMCDKGPLTTAINDFFLPLMDSRGHDG